MVVFYVIDRFARPPSVHFVNAIQDLKYCQEET